MCRAVQGSRAAFYRHWEATEPDQVEMELRDALQRTALRHRSYGYRRLRPLLEKQGWKVGETKLRRLLKQDNLLAVRRRKFVPTTDSNHRFRVYPNLAQYLELNQINQLWVADMTYIRLLKEFVYLAVVIDAYSRRAIGWALGRRHDTALGLCALEQAIAARQPQPGLVHHSDRGTAYAGDDYVRRLEQIQAVLSMSRPGRPWENGICESFIKSLKQEEIDARPYRDLAELEANITEFLEQVYNRQRLHSALGYQSPEQFEQQPARRDAVSWLPAALNLPRHEEVLIVGGS